MLTEEQVAHYETFGFLVLRELFTPEEAATTQTLSRPRTRYCWKVRAEGIYDRMSRRPEAPGPGPRPRMAIPRIHGNHRIPENRKSQISGKLQICFTFVR